MTKLDVHNYASLENYINWREYSNIPSSSREPGERKKKLALDVLSVMLTNRYSSQNSSQALTLLQAASCFVR